MIVPLFTSLIVSLSFSGAAMANPTEEVVAFDLDFLAEHAAALHKGIRARHASLSAKLLSHGRQLTDSFRGPSKGLVPRRRLQDEDCVPAELYFFDDDYLTIFGEDFGPMCTCNNEETDIDGFLATADFTDVGQFVTDFNALLRSGSFVDEYECMNDCASCLSDVCGFISEGESTVTNIDLSRDITALDLLTLANATEDEADTFINSLFLVEDTSYSTFDCYDFVTGDETGKVCLNLAFAITPDEPITLDDLLLLFPDTADGLDISVTVEDEACSSCAATETDDDFCVSCECDNVVPGASPTDCVADPESTFIGIFDPYYDFDVSEDTFATNFTVGQCGGPPTDQIAVDPPPTTSAAGGFRTFLLCWAVAGLTMTAALAW